MLSTTSRGRIVDLVCVGIIVCVCLLVALPRFRAGIDWADEGFLAYGTVRVMEGQIPNRDFVSLQPPLSFYVAAATFKSLGTSLASLRVLGLLIHLLIPLLLYAIARNFMKPVLSMASALPAVILGIPTFNFVPFAVWQGITVSLAAVFLFVRSTLTAHRWLALVSGMLTTVSIFLRQDQGIYMALSILVLAVACRFAKKAPLSRHELNRVLVLWLAGFAGVAGALGIFWWSQGALPGMFQQLVVFPLTMYSKTSALPFPSFSEGVSLSQNALAALFYFPPVVMIFAAIWLSQRIVRGKFGFRAGVLMFLLVWAALFFCQALTRSDLSHLLITLPPFFLLMAYCWQIVLQAFGKKRSAKVTVSILAAAAGCGFLWTVRSLVLPDPAKATEAVALARGGVRVENGTWITNFIHGAQNNVPASRSILVLPYQPMFYFLSERRNPTHWNYLWPGDQSAADHERLIEQARSDPPAVVLITGESDMESYAQPILEYVHRDYRLAGQAGRIRIYAPRGATP